MTATTFYLAQENKAPGEQQEVPKIEVIENQNLKTINEKYVVTDGVLASEHGLKKDIKNKNTESNSGGKIYEGDVSFIEFLRTTMPMSQQKSKEMSKSIIPINSNKGVQNLKNIKEIRATIPKD